MTWATEAPWESQRAWGQPTLRRCSMASMMGALQALVNSGAVWGNEAVSMSHYRFDERAAAARVRAMNGIAIRNESNRAHGGHFRHRLSLVPLHQINAPPVWKPSRLASVRAAIAERSMLPPVSLTTSTRADVFEISDVARLRRRGRRSVCPIASAKVGANLRLTQTFVRHLTIVGRSLY